MSPTPSTLKESSTARILVADDDRVISTLICGVLAEAGHKPMPALDAMQALMFAMRAPVPELIVLDVNMPGGTGVEALRKLKQSTRTRTRNACSTQWVAWWGAR